MKDSETSTEYKLSTYNSAGNQIKRLDSLWESAHRDVRSGNYLDWNILLDRLWLEISGDLAPDSTEQKIMDRFNQELVKILPLSTGNFHGFNKRTQDGYIKLSKQYNLLRAKEMFVKRMENKLGLGKAYVDEFEDDWD